jgi:hypothetical protein
MTTYNPRMDAAPVAISGSVGSTVSLYDLLVKAYGENISQIQSVFVNVQSEYGIYWNGAATGPTTLVTDASNNQIGSGGENILASDFKNVQIKIGDNINNIVNVTVPESSGNGPFVGHTLSVSVLPSQLDEHVPADHVPTAADIVASAKMFATAESGVFNSNDCHGIATAIAASAGATLDPNTGNTLDIAANPNEQSGFWRIAATGAAVAANWETQVQAGDIVRFEHEDNGVLNQHTVTVVSGLNAAGQIEVVDNWNSVIGDHWIDFNKATDVLPGTVTIFRLTTDGLYLTDQSKETTNDNILGTTFNDLIKAGSGNDTLTGGAGNDTLDGGAGDNTAVFSGKESDYKITVAGGTATIADLRAGLPDGTDTITNIEHVKFSDITVNYSDLKSTPVAPPPVAGSVSINNVSMTEGNNGTMLETFTVTRSGGNAAFDVNFATADGTATAADKDYNAQSGTLHFAQGAVSQIISVVVNGDTKVEGNETYDVNLSGPTNGATISHAQGVGTIVNDDVAVPAPVAGSVTINNVSMTEGNNGTMLETFTVTRSGGDAAFDVNFATADGTATAADKDYNAQSGTLHFAQGAVSQTISVVVNGDTKVEGNEAYDVNLSGATNGATISHAQGVGTIVNDDVAVPAPVAGSVTINNVSMTEGNSGTVLETFTVTRSGGDAAFDVNFATADGTATAADKDYDSQSGTLHFAQGAVSQTISVVVHGDTKVEGNETYDVDLSGATNGATISHAEGVGTIVNDDTAAATVTSHVVNDFNGDGISDVLLGNNNGTLALWELNGNQITSNTTVGSVASGWHVEGTADFNGDGTADILLHSDNGSVALWQMNGDHIVSNNTFGTIGTDFHVAGVGDFSGDGKSDILWQNSQGQVVMWEMNGDHIASNTTVGTMGTDFKVAGVGDFNGDGKSDILWENSKGQVVMWEMNGDKIASNTTVGNVSPDWHVAGTGDFNGDGKIDILWQNSKGQIAEWQMNGDHVASNTTVGSASGMTVIGTGDYNHDGKADVLLQDTSGHVTEWQMNGDHITATQSVGSHSVDWHMV